MRFVIRKCQIDGTHFPLDYAQPCEVCFEDRWSFWCEKHAKPAELRGCEDCAFGFFGKRFFDEKEIGIEFSNSWDNAVRLLTANKLSTWLMEFNGNRVLGGQIKEIEQSEVLGKDIKVALAVVLLCNDDRLRWKGAVVDAAWMRKNDSLQLFDSPIAENLRRLGALSWFCELEAYWRTLYAEIGGVEPKQTALAVLFKNTSKVKSLSTALSLSTLVPRMHLPSGWSGKRSAVRELAQKVADGVLSPPAIATLKTLFSELAKVLKLGGELNWGNKEFYAATFIAGWRFEGKTLIEDVRFKSLLRDYLITNSDARLLKSLIFGYLRDYSLENFGYIEALSGLIREYLEVGRGREFEKWKKLHSDFGLFEGLNAPQLSAKHFSINGNIEESLRIFGLGGNTLWEGFSAELLLAWIKGNGPYGQIIWDAIRYWFEKTFERFSNREHEWIEVVVGIWKTTAAPAEIRKAVSRYLLDRYGEPGDTPIWNECSSDVRNIVTHWLLFENLEKFFDLIGDYAAKSGGEMAGHWAYRRAFWLAVHKTGAVTDLRIAVGKGLQENFGIKKLRERFGSKLVKLNGERDRCALVLRLGPLTIVDFTHNAKCRVWKSGVEQEQWFSGNELSRVNFTAGTDMIIRPHFVERGIAHYNSESYGWQDAMAEFLKPYLPAKISRADLAVGSDSSHWLGCGSD